MWLLSMLRTAKKEAGGGRGDPEAKLATRNGRAQWRLEAVGSTMAMAGASKESRAAVVEADDR